jgi:hypothetical protein
MSAPVDVGPALGRVLRASPPRGLVSAYLFGSHAAGSGDMGRGRREFVSIASRIEAASEPDEP